MIPSKEKLVSIVEKWEDLLFRLKYDRKFKRVEWYWEWDWDIIFFLQDSLCCRYEKIQEVICDRVFITK